MINLSKPKSDNGFLIIRSIFLIILLLLINTSVLAQPFSVGVQPFVWLSSNQVAQPDSTFLIGNHFGLKKADFAKGISKVNTSESYGLSVFLVLRPTFPSVRGGTFFNSGSICLGDSGLSLLGNYQAMNFEKGKPTIVSFRCPFQNAVSGRKHFNIRDTSLFDVAEIIVFQKMLKDEERRSVETYLSLKYSIPTPKKRKELGSYIYRMDGEPYWSRKRDKDFDTEIVALGNFDQNNFNQSQTIAYFDDSIKFSLDTNLAPGEMPVVNIDSGSNIIFSKSKRLSAELPCEDGKFLLRGWQFILNDWSSSAEYLVIQQIGRNPARSEPDTMLISNGVDSLVIPGKIFYQKVKYKIPLGSLSNKSFYRFRRFITDCPEDSSTYYISELKADSLKLSFDNELLPLEMEVMNVRNGESDLFMIHNQNVAIYNLTGQQYILRISDTLGYTKINQLHTGSGTSEKEKVSIINLDSLERIEGNLNDRYINLYPNPAVAGEEVMIEISGFPDKSGKLLVYNGSGDLLTFKKMASPSITQSILAPLSAGHYTVIFEQSSKLYVKKLIVKK